MNVRTYLTVAAVLALMIAGYMLFSPLLNWNSHRQLAACEKRDQTAQLDALRGERDAAMARAGAANEQLAALKAQAEFIHNLSQGYAEQNNKLQARLAATQGALSKLETENKNVRAQLDTLLDPAIARSVREQRTASAASAGGDR